MRVLALLLLLSTPALAETDDTDFLFRMGMLEGHLMIGGELLDAGQVPMALPHFGHPVRELYDDIADYIAAKKIRPFETDLIRLEAAIAGAPRDPATKQMFAGVIATLHRAREAAPPALRDSIPEMIRICADTLDAASGEYGEAIDRGRIASIVEYHDSRGYLAFVAQELNRMNVEASPADAGLIARFRAVLARAQWIVGPLLPGSTPRASLADYRRIAAEGAKVARP
jgi:hypothetical protein